MKALRVAVLLLVAAAMVSPVAAAEAVRVVNGWTRATLPGQKVAGIYLEILSPMDATVTGVTFPKARSAELHSMKMENGTMKMRPVKRLDLAAGQWLKLEPGGLHIMAFDLEAPLRAGQKLPLSLTVEMAGRSREVNATITVLSSDTAGGHEHH